MSASVAKRVLNDQTASHNNHFNSVVNKKRKLDIPDTKRPTFKHPKIEQVKSSFEEDLGRLTQEVDGLKGCTIILEITTGSSV